MTDTETRENLHTSVTRWGVQKPPDEQLDVRGPERSRYHVLPAGHLPLTVTATGYARSLYLSSFHERS